jgi:pimeloyl-ACP methyl ester carboxylesterase
MPTVIDKRKTTLPNGQQINYYIAGPADGTRLLLLHGGGTDNALLSWTDTIPALVEAGYRIYAPDWPGHGDSPLPNVRFTVEYLIATLDALMTAWEIDRATLIGISMGGGVALGTALNHPHRVDRLVLIGSYGLQDKAPGHAWSHRFVKAPMVNKLSWWSMRQSRGTLRSMLKTIVRNPASLTDKLVDDVAAAIARPDAQRVFAQFQEDEVRRDGMKTVYMPRLGEITVPVLLLHGSHDIGVPVHYAEEAAQRLPNARLRIIQNAGHWTQRDYPQHVNREILAFLAET